MIVRQMSCKTHMTHATKGLKYCLGSRYVDRHRPGSLVFVGGLGSHVVWLRRTRVIGVPLPTLPIVPTPAPSLRFFSESVLLV